MGLLLSNELFITCIFSEKGSSTSGGNSTMTANNDRNVQIQNNDCKRPKPTLFEIN